MEDLISVIIPVYNVEKYIYTCLNSIINQTYKNLEIILVDDGSPDNCPQILEDYAKKDSRIKVIHKKNGGLSSARNAGMKIATGKYIAFVDSDDSLNLNMYKRLHELAIKYDADMTMCQLLRVTMDSENNIVYPKTNNEEKEEVMSVTEALKAIMVNDNIGSYIVTKLVKRSLFDNIEFPDGKVYEDVATVYKILDRAKRVVFTSEEMYYYLYGREGSITGTFTEKKICDSMEAYYGRYKFLVDNYPEIEKDACLNWVKLYTSAMEKINMNSYEELWNSQVVLENYESFKVAFDKLDEKFLNQYLEPYRLISAVLLRHSRDTYKDMFPVIYNKVKNAK